MLRFLWHWLFHGMRSAHEHWERDLTITYLCKCGKAFVVVRGWREDRKWFTHIKETDGKEAEKFIDAVRRDAQTL